MGRTLTLPYRPQSNGLVERANKEVGRHLRALLMEQRVSETWSVALPMIQRVLNATPNRTIGTTPIRVMFGGAVSPDRGLFKPQSESSRVETLEDYIAELAETQLAIVDASREHQKRVIDEYLSKSPEQPTEIQDGDYVLVSYPAKPPSKLHPRWKGPMLVVEHSLSTYHCQDVNTLKIHQLHISRLKRYNMDQTPDPLAVASVDDAEYVVEQVIDHRPGPRRQDWTFRVRWRGYGPSEDSWLPYAEVQEVQALRAYLLAHPGLRL